MNRRGFLGTMLGVMAAPAVVKAENLMKIVVPKQEIILPVKLRNQNGISGAFIGDMDINCMYDPVVPVYDKEMIDRISRQIKMAQGKHLSGYC